MSLRYRIMYRVGFVPWDTDRVPDELRAVAERPGAAGSDRALDIGCGTGTQAVHLAERGWQVTGIDAVGRPLEAARKSAAAAGVEVEWVQADVADLPELGLEPGYALIHDRGCFHDLPARTRTAYVRGVSGLAAPGATLLLMTFARNSKLAGPAGADESELRDRFGGDWEVASAEPDSGPPPGGPMRDVPRTWYRLVRRSSA